MVIDAHLHIFPALTGFPDGRGNVSLRYGQTLEAGHVVQAMPPSFEFSSSPPEIALRYMDLCGVDKAILTQAPYYGLHNTYVNQALEQWPERFFGLAMFNPLLGKKAVDDVDFWLSKPGFVGIKVEVPYTVEVFPEFELAGEQQMAVWMRVADMRGLLVFHLLPGSDQCKDVMKLVERLPNLRVCIAHLGQPSIEGWREQVRLAKHPRVFLDTSALPWHYRETEEYPYPSAQRDLEWAVSEVGADKILWGSDYPTLLLDCTYQQLLNLVKVQCRFLTPAQRELLLGGTAGRLMEGRI